jgi:NADPH-dependent 2,4-dienoyl-CoA reductase/sulfur reductase-like enzyme
MAPRVLIIGASLAGLRSAEAVLAALPGAEVTLVGEEPHVPYNRPPLSKEALAGLVAGDGGIGEAGLSPPADRRCRDLAAGGAGGGDRRRGPDRDAEHRRATGL